MSFLPKFKIASLLLVFRFLMFEISLRVFQGLIDVDGLFMIFCVRGLKRLVFKDNGFPPGGSHCLVKRSSGQNHPFDHVLLI